MLLDIAIVKQHLRVEGDEDNSLITLYANAAEQMAFEFMNRRVYADSTQLGQAVTSSAATMLTALNDYVAAVASAGSLPFGVVQDAAIQQALNAYLATQAQVQMIRGGIVLNDAIRSALLLMTGHLYENRQQAQPGEVKEIPMGAYCLLQPYRIGLGV